MLSRLAALLYPLSLRAALPISRDLRRHPVETDRPATAHGDVCAAPGLPHLVLDHPRVTGKRRAEHMRVNPEAAVDRSEEHTSELQSRENVVCRLSLEKKKVVPI